MYIQGIHDNEGYLNIDCCRLRIIVNLCKKKEEEKNGELLELD